MANSLPAGMRNNNPGNIKFVPTINWRGQVGPSANLDQGDPQVVFATPEAGMRALAKNVLYKFNRGATTINQLIAGPNGWTPGYEPGAAGVAEAAGYAPDQPLNMNDPNVLGHVMRGIVTQEQGPSSRLYSDQLIAIGMGAAGIPQYDAAGNPIASAAPPAATGTASPAAAPASMPKAAQTGPSDDDLLSKFLGPSSAPANSNTEPATGDRATELRAATGAPAVTDDDLLAKYLGSAPAASTAAPEAVTPPPVPVAPAAQTAPGLGGSSEAFQQSTMNSMPVIGPLVNDAVDFVGSHIASAITGKSPEEMQQVAQAREQQIAAANPAETTAGNVVGSLVPFAAIGPESGAAKLLGAAADYGKGAIGNFLLRSVAGAGSGAAIAGADTLARGGTLGQAKNNALLGGAVGAAAPAVLGTAGKAIGAAKNAFMGPNASKMVANALMADENAPENVNQLLQQRGPGATVADLGPNTQGLTGGLASLPGKAQSIVVNNLKARSAQTGARLAQDVAGTIGQGQPIGALTDQIIAGQKATAAPLYEAIRDVPVQITPELKEFLSTPLGKSALAKGQELAANDGIRLGNEAPPTKSDIANKVMSGRLTPEQGERAMSAIDSGAVSTPPKLTVGILDYAKRALDDRASTALRTGANNDARQASSKAADLTAAVDSQVPGYAAARDAYAGPAKVLDAVEMGQQIFSGKTSPEDLQGALAGMSPSEKDGLIAGAQAAVQKAIGNARTDAAGVKSLFDSANGKQKLALLVGQDQADKIEKALERERTFSDTAGKAYRNSVTSANLAQQRILNPDLAGVPKQMAPQSSIGLLISGLEKARSAVTGAYRNAQNVRLANMLTGGGLSPKDAGAIARAAKPLNPLLALSPGATQAYKRMGAAVPGLGSFAQPEMVFRDGKWIPRIYVRGATVIGQ